MKKLILLCALFSLPALADDVLLQAMAVTTTAAESSQLQLLTGVLVQCDQDVYISQINTGGTAASSTTSVKLLAGQAYETSTKAGRRYLSIKAITTSGTCLIFKVVN